MSKTIAVLACAFALTLTAGKCSREHVKSVEMMNKCVEYHRAQQMTKAIDHCRKAVGFDPENEKAQHALGLVYFDAKEYEPAAQYLQNAVELDDSVPLYHYQLGQIYQAMSKFEPAVEQYARAVELDSKLFKAHYRLGRVYEEMDNPERALQKYTDSLMTNPRFFEAYRNLGSLYQDYHFLGQSEQVFKEGIKALEGRGDELAILHHRLGTVYSDKKAYDEAIAEFRDALELDPGLVDALFSLGWTYSYVNKENAKIWLKKFVASAGSQARPDYVQAARARLREIERGVAF